MFYLCCQQVASGNAGGGVESIECGNVIGPGVEGIECGKASLGGVDGAEGGDSASSEPLNSLSVSLSSPPPFMFSLYH